MKEIQLTQGKVALVDDNDYERLLKIKWHANWCRRSKTYYAYGHYYKDNGERSSISMHRFLTKAVAGEVVDHGDHNGLNNQRGNLTKKDRINNCKNIRISSRNTSGFVGVTWHKNHNKWMASITVNLDVIYLGYFHKKQDAIDARKKANIKYGFHSNHGKNILSEKNGKLESKYRISIKNKSGTTGVAFCNTSKKWQSYIFINSIRICLGCFDVIDEAIKEREKAEIQKAMKYHVEFI